MHARKVSHLSFKKSSEDAHIELSSCVHDLISTLYSLFNVFFDILESIYSIILRHWFNKSQRDLHLIAKMVICRFLIQGQVVLPCILEHYQLVVLASRGPDNAWSRLLRRCAVIEVDFIMDLIKMLIARHDRSLTDQLLFSWILALLGRLRLLRWCVFP